MRARQSLSEAIAVNAAAHVRKQQWVDLTTTLETQVDRNPDLLSVGIRSDLGILRVDTGHHEEMWPVSEEDKNKVDAVHVPITLNRRPWGRVELCFRAASYDDVRADHAPPVGQVAVVLFDLWRVRLHLFRGTDPEVIQQHAGRA